MIVHNRSPYGPRYRVRRSPPPEVYLTDVLIDIVLIWGHALRCAGCLLLGVCRGAARELRATTVEQDIAAVVTQIRRRRP